MTNGTVPATAPVANYNPRWEDVEFPNPSISSKTWNFNYDDAKSLEKTLGVFLPFGSIVLFFALFSRFSPFGHIFSEVGGDGDPTGGFLFLGIFLAMLVGSYFLASKLAKRMISSRNRNRDEYRAANASTIIDALAEQGWNIVGKNAVQTLIKDNNPYLTNANGVRYYARQFYIGKENVTFMVELRDAETEQAMKAKEKQSRIEFLVKRYEDANGTMTPEMKAGFEAGLNMGLRIE